MQVHGPLHYQKNSNETVSRDYQPPSLQMGFQHPSHQHFYLGGVGEQNHIYEVEALPHLDTHACPASLIHEDRDCGRAGRETKGDFELLFPQVVCMDSTLDKLLHFSTKGVGHHAKVLGVGIAVRIRG